MPESIALSLTNDRLIKDSCYRELTFQGKSELSAWKLILYASPDLRFLSDELFDTQRDPVEEERDNNEAVMKGLIQGAIAARGPNDAPVAIVVFSDFQCPFCGNFARMLDEALDGGRQAVRVVFRHFPLANHSWARAAAEGAACAQLQNSQAFWSLHDQLFRNQASTTPDNIKERLNEFAKTSKELDVNAFQQCVANSMSLGLVLRDMNLAAANQVNGTPTICINGHRVQGVESTARLRELITKAREEAAATSGRDRQEPSQAGNNGSPSKLP